MLHKKEVEESQVADQLKKYDRAQKKRARLRERARALGLTVAEYRAIDRARATL